MKYEIIYSKVFDKEFSKLNKKLQLIVLRKILRLADDPRAFGKSLKGPLGGLWELKVSKFRIVYKIMYAEKKISVETIDLRGHMFK